jgi:hypothetical protein
MVIDPRAVAILLGLITLFSSENYTGSFPEEDCHSDWNLN